MLRYCLLAAMVCSMAAQELPQDTSVRVIKLGGRSLLAVQAPDRRSDPATTLLLQQPLWMDFDNTPVAEACDAVSRATGANIVVSNELRVDGPDITMQIDNMRAELVLKWISELGNVHMTPMNGGILVSAEPPRSKNRLVLYDASALTMSIPDFPGPEMGINPTDKGIVIHQRALPVEDDSDKRLDNLVNLIEDHLRVVQR